MTTHGWTVEHSRRRRAAPSTPPANSVQHAERRVGRRGRLPAHQPHRTARNLEADRLDPHGQRGTDGLAHDRLREPAHLDRGDARHPQLRDERDRGQRPGPPQRRHRTPRPGQSFGVAAGNAGSAAPQRDDHPDAHPGDCAGLRPRGDHAAHRTDGEPQPGGRRPCGRSPRLDHFAHRLCRPDYRRHQHLVRSRPGPLEERTRRPIPKRSARRHRTRCADPEAVHHQGTGARPPRTESALRGTAAQRHRRAGARAPRASAQNWDRPLRRLRRVTLLRDRP